MGEPFEGGYTAWVAPAERADGSACVLKLPYPAEESRYEAERCCSGTGTAPCACSSATRSTRALLLERLLPGTTLFDLADPEEALEVACGVAPAPVEPRPGRRTRSRRAHARAVGQRERRRAPLPRAWTEPFDAALLRRRRRGVRAARRLRRRVRRPAPGLPPRQRAAGAARAVARDRPQAAGRRARLRRALAALRPRSTPSRAARCRRPRCSTGSPPSSRWTRSASGSGRRARGRERALVLRERRHRADDDLALAAALA